jgi:hypothetical protein
VGIEFWAAVIGAIVLAGVLVVARAGLKDSPDR